MAMNDVFKSLHYSLLNSSNLYHLIPEMRSPLILLSTWTISFSSRILIK